MAGSHVEEGKSQISVFDKGLVKRVAHPRHICLGAPSGGMRKGIRRMIFHKFAIEACSWLTNCAEAVKTVTRD